MGSFFSHAATAIYSHPMVQSMQCHPLVQSDGYFGKTREGQTDEEWYGEAETEAWDLTVGPWKLIGSGIWEMDKALYHMTARTFGIE